MNGLIGVIAFNYFGFMIGMDFPTSKLAVVTGIPDARWLMSVTF